MPDLSSSLQFANLVATTMDELRSSHVFFILQQAYKNINEDMMWSDFQELLTKVIQDTDAFKKV